MPLSLPIVQIQFVLFYIVAFRAIKNLYLLPGTFFLVAVPFDLKVKTTQTFLRQYELRFQVLSIL